MSRTDYREPLGYEGSVVERSGDKLTDKDAHRMLVRLQVGWDLKNHVTVPLPEPRCCRTTVGRFTNNGSNLKASRQEMLSPEPSIFGGVA
jgi:hypothetical protein